MVACMWFVLIPHYYNHNVFTKMPGLAFALVAESILKGENYSYKLSQQSKDRSAY
jgi:hypothetical protein